MEELKNKIKNNMSLISNLEKEVKEKKEVIRKIKINNQVYLIQLLMDKGE